jgi:integrase/recombinase XerC
MFGEFEGWLRRQDRAEATCAGYLSEMAQFARWFQQANGEPLTAMDVTPVDVQSYRRDLLAQGLSPATVNRRLSAIRAWGRFLQDSEKRLDSVAGGVQDIHRARESTAPRSLDRHELHRFLRAAQRGRHAVRDYALVQLMLQTGLRIGEVAALQVDDVVLNGRSGRVLVRCGKGRRTRTVLLNTTARKALAAWLAIRPMDVHNRALFTSQKGGPLAKVSMQQAIQGLMREAGVSGHAAHSLRHTFAMMYLEDSRDLRGLCDLLGHASTKTTMIYTRPTEAQLGARLEGMSLNAY